MQYYISDERQTACLRHVYVVTACLTIYSLVADLLATQHAWIYMCSQFVEHAEKELVTNDIVTRVFLVCGVPPNFFFHEKGSL